MFGRDVPAHWLICTQVAAVKELIAAGADKDLRDGKGHTVAEILDAAAPSGIIDRLKLAIA